MVLNVVGALVVVVEVVVVAILVVDFGMGDVSDSLQKKTLIFKLNDLCSIICVL